jgi:hypothetical protein
MQIRGGLRLENKAIWRMSATNYSKGEASLIAVAAIVGVLHPLWYWSIFSGDAEIHLVYANNLLRGHPMEFNLNEPNSGETSMGFMLADALIMWVFGAAATPVVIKFLCLSALYSTAVATWLVAARLGVQRPWREFAALFTLWLPGSVYNAMAGTENGLFAALSCLFVFWTTLLHWYDEEGGPTLRRDGLAGLAAGGLFWLRPETLPLAVILLFMRFIGTLWFKRPVGRELTHIGVFSLTFAVMIVAYIVIFIHYAHEAPYGAGRARRLLSIFQDSVWLGPISVNSKVLFRVVSYFGVVVPALATVGVAAFGNAPDRSERLGTMTLGAVFFGFLAAYEFNLLPSVHFARYTIFVWPYGLILAALGLQTALRSPRFNRQAVIVVIAILGASFVGVGAYETHLRRNMALGGALAKVERAPERREASSANLARSLGLPVGAHATLGIEEVQIRYEIADNFEIRSLDGVTDSRLLSYFCDEWIDHDGYFIDTKVDYLMAFPSRNHDRSVWSLNDLDQLGVGGTVARPGITYTKIGPDIVRIDRTVDNSSARPGPKCSTAAR